MLLGSIHLGLEAQVFYTKYMIVPILIGKNSNGENQFLDLSEIPLLIISYSDEFQLNQLFKSICQNKYPYRQPDFIVCNSRRLKKWEPSQKNNLVFIRDNPEIGTIKTRKALLNTVMIEIKRREKILKEKRVIFFSKYNQLNHWNIDQLGYRFLLVDDIWDIVTAKPKSLSLDLFRIILYGPTVGIHTIIASGISYRNLLQQLVILNPAISVELQKKFGIPEPTQIGLLGEELILTPDNLIYHKKKNIADLQRYFKV